MLGQNEVVTKKFIKLLTAIREEGGVECEQVPHIFFPEDVHGLDKQYIREVKLAIEICKRCPVQRLCADYAIIAKEPYGIWGGTTSQDR